MSKKILSVALALIFVISTFAVSAFAVGGTAFEEDPDAYTQAWSLAELESDTEGTYKVGVYLDASYLVGAVQFQIVNEDGNAILGGVESGLFTDGDFDIQYTEDGLVFIVPTPADTAASAVDTATTETLIATLSYTLKEGASSATLAIADDAKSETNPGGSLIAVRMSDDNLVTGTMIYGQSATVGEAITIGSAAAELVLTETGSTAGVVIDTNITFGEAYAGVVYGITSNNYKAKTTITNNVTASNNGTLVVKTSDGKTTASGNYGTGSTIEVFNSDGTSTGKVYVFVAFGDVDGNGLINASDIKTAAQAISTASLLANGSPARMAANCDTRANATLLHTINAADVKRLAQHVGGTKIDQAAQAALLSSNGTKYA